MRGLSAHHKELPCKYFYDETGSRLFERICALPEYYPTRAELAILKRDSREMAARMGPDCLLVELGSGSGVKTRALLDHLVAPVAYVPVDISREQLLASARALVRDYPAIEVRPLCADFTLPFEIPAVGRPARGRMVYFPGSTIGNFSPEQARHLLTRMARLCAPNGGDAARRRLEERSPDAARRLQRSEGVTAAFNLNLLVRINRELRADFGVERFWHHALYNPREGRIEMYLVSRLDQRVRVGDREIFLAEGEPICTEYSYKYSVADLTALAAASGFAVERSWMDESRYFCVLYLAARTERKLKKPSRGPRSN